MNATTEFQITGSNGEPIRGTKHAPAGSPRAVVLLAHGFLGYKDYGFIPAIAQCFAEAGCVCHRFNFSHSGVGQDPSTFERPDLFTLDTWSTQVNDLALLASAIESGTMAGQGAPLVLAGHSRGGTSCLLAAGRGDVNASSVITIAAPDSCCSLPENDRRTLLDTGELDRPSNRTGQTLKTGRAWLQEQLDDPEAHDPIGLAAKIRVPVLAIHGDADATVPPAAAQAIASAVPNGRCELVPGADHVFNTPNPNPPDRPHSEQLRALLALLRSSVQKP